MLLLACLLVSRGSELHRSSRTEAARAQSREVDPRVLLRRQPDEGLLGGMWLPPSTPWREEAWSEGEALGHAPAAAEWEDLGAEARHVFTHFSLGLEIWRAAAPAGFTPDAEERFVKLEDLPESGLPSVGRKVWKLAAS